MKKILVYIGRTKIKKENLESVFNKLKLKYAYLSDEHLKMKMSELVSLDNMDYTPGTKEGFMYVDTNDVKEIQDFDSLLKEAQADIERKAIITDNNIGWTLEELIDEVDREYNYFKLKDRLYYLVSNPDREKINNDENYLKLMSMAYSLLENDPIEEELLEIAIRSIETYTK